jgi:hypothetical protein
MMKKLRSQSIEGRWTTDWWEIADGVNAVVRIDSVGTCSIKVKASVPSSLHVVNSSLPAHWQKDHVTDITKAMAIGPLHSMGHLLRNGGITMQADGVEDWSIEVESASLESTLHAIAENYAAHG